MIECVYMHEGVVMATETWWTREGKNKKGGRMNKRIRVDTEEARATSNYYWEAYNASFTVYAKLNNDTA